MDSWTHGNIKPIYGATEMATATSDAKDLIDRVSTYVSPDIAGLVEQAYEFADECHRGQKRVSGEPYIAHPLQTALFLADLRLDANTVVAALLHDVVEDCDVTLDELASRFGKEVAKLVDGVTKLTKLDVRLHQSGNGQSVSEEPDNLYAESLRKMLVAMAEDIRVVLIKLADRLHNMQTLDVLPLRNDAALPRKRSTSTLPWPIDWGFGRSSGGWMTWPFPTWTKAVTTKSPT